MNKSFQNGYALLIGVGECEYSRLSLPVTVKDTQAIYKVLIDPALCAYKPENVKILNNQSATKENILEGLRWLKKQAELAPDSTIFVYYSGHGGCPKDNNTYYYLLPHDYQDPSTNAISAEELTMALRSIQSQRLLVVIDSCHAAGMATSKDDVKAEAELNKALGNLQRSAPSAKFCTNLANGKGRVVFTSCTKEQSSYIKKDNSLSIYTYRFLEALQGLGTSENEKFVTVFNLMNYLEKTVSKTVREEYPERQEYEQTPYFDLGSEGWAIALLRGGKGLPREDTDNDRAEVQSKPSQQAEVITGDIQGKNVVVSLKVEGGGSVHIGDQNNSGS